MELTKQLSNCWKKAYMKAKVGGYEFEPIEEFEACRVQLSSGKHLIGEESYMQYIDTKAILAHLGMKDAEYKAQSSQLSTTQMHINKLFGSTIEMYLDVLNR